MTITCPRCSSLWAPTMADHIAQKSSIPICPCCVWAMTPEGRIAVALERLGDAGPAVAHEGRGGVESCLWQCGLPGLHIGLLIIGLLRESDQFLVRLEHLAPHVVVELLNEVDPARHVGAGAQSDEFVD